MSPLGGAISEPDTSIVIAPAATVDVTVAIPVLNEEENIPELYERLTKTLSATGRSYEILFVDDGSTDRSAIVMKELHDKDPHVSVVRFSTNFGQQAGCFAALAHAKGAFTLLIDADLQVPPEEVPKFIAKFDEGYEAVYGVRRVRHDSLIRRMGSKVIWGMLARATGTRIEDAAGLFGFRRTVVDFLARCPERIRFITGLVAWLKVPTAYVEVDHQPRTRGESKYNLIKLVRYALDCVTSFSITPLRIASILGILAAIGGFVLAAYYIILKLFTRVQPGFTTEVVAILIFSGAQLLTIGILGEYIGRIYIEVKRRPHFIVREYLSSRGPQAPPRTA